MDGPDHLDILSQGVAVWNKWRRENPTVLPNLAGAQLRGLDLRHVVLRRADLTGADLQAAVLMQADLSWARLEGANLANTWAYKADFSKADLLKANCQRASFSGASFNGAQLVRADFSHATLSGASFSTTHIRETLLAQSDWSMARLGWTTIADCDLTSARGLDAVAHYGPSSIGLDTIYRSQGQVPEAFLRKAGIPDSFITYARSLVTNPIAFYSCFISYSTNDQVFADRLCADLQNRGVRCWFAPRDVQGGKKLHEQIDRAIGIYDRLLLILSEHSMSSEWVMTEISHARQRELNERRQVLFPISLVSFAKIREWKFFDADIGKDSSREIREYFVPDFSSWKDHDSYQRSFERLLRDLKAESDASARS